MLFSGLTKEQANNLEVFLISYWETRYFQHGYNIAAGGGGTTGVFPSAETRAKKAIRSMRENLSEDTLRKRSEALRGRKFSEEHKRRIGDSNSKKIDMFSTDGVYIRSFPSAYAAEKELGIGHTHISQCCTGKRQTTGGYKWSFAQ